MTWEYQECYILFSQYSEYLKSSLGISQLDYYLDKQVLLPYYTQITKYLNERLIILGSDDIMTKITEILRIFSYGADLICNEGTLDLAYEVGVPSGDEEFDRDRFVFSWTNALTSLCMRLKFQYANLFVEDQNWDCCTCLPKGQTVKDYESWTSGIYPEDEEYDRSNYTRSNSAWSTTSGQKNRNCGCYRG